MYISGNTGDFASRVHQLPTTSGDITNFITEGNTYFSGVSGIDRNLLYKWNKEIGTRFYSLLNSTFYFINQAITGGINTGTGGGSLTNGNYISSGLLGYWKFNEGSGTTSANLVSGNSAMQLSGSPTWSQGYVNFNGSTQFATAGTGAIYNSPSALSLCIWINPLAYAPSSNVAPFFEKGYNGSLEGYFVRYDNSTNTNLIGCGSYNGGGAVPGVDIPNPTPTGQWSFVAAVYDGTFWNLYLNGVLANNGQNSAAYGPQVVNEPLLIAARTIVGVPSNFFSGAVHDAAVYNRALSANEVMTNYLNTQYQTGINKPDLLYLKMAESGQTGTPLNLKDSSTANNTCTMYGNDVAWETGVGGQVSGGMHFHGVANYIDTANTTGFNFTSQNFSINSWLRPYTANGYLMTNGTPNGSGWYLQFNNIYEITFGSEGNGTDSQFTSTMAAGNNATWTMVTLTRTAANVMNIYINGALINTTTSFASPSSSSASLILGKDYAGSHYYDGDMWEPQIWSSGLQATDVANLYAHQLSGIPWP